MPGLMGGLPNPCPGDRPYRDSKPRALSLIEVYNYLNRAGALSKKKIELEHLEKAVSEGHLIRLLVAVKQGKLPKSDRREKKN